MDQRRTGIEPEITQVYLLAVRLPGVTRDRLLAENVSPDIVDIAVRELLARGLLRPGGEEDSWEAMPPEVALPVMANALESRAAEARALGPDLAMLYRQVRAAPTVITSGVRVFTNLQELHDTAAEILSSATQEVRRIFSATPRTAFVFDSHGAGLGAPKRTPDGYPLRHRTIYDASVMALPRASEVVKVRADAGEEARYLTDLTSSCLIVDDTHAVLDLTAFDSSGAGSCLVTDRRMVLALAAEWESWWRRSSPGLSSDGTASEELDSRSQDILRLLATGATDATIALQTGLSQRTVERGVRALLDRLGATTRFQAGVQAALRGWL